MAWTYFTSYLDGTRPILKAERDELADELALKLTFPCGRFGLDSTRQTAIRASLLATDLIGVRDGVSTFAQGLYTAITSTYALAFGGSSAVTDAQTTALAAEGIDDTDLAEIRSGNVDSFRLWNFFKRFIDELVITPAELGLMSKRSVSASKTKCGYTEFPGYESFPPRIYQTKTLGGFNRQTGWSNSGCTGTCLGFVEWTYSGTCTINRATCAETVGGNAHIDEGFTNCSTVDYADDFAACSTDFDPPWFITETISATVVNRTGNGCAGGANTTGTSTTTLSDELTTAILSADVDAALPAFSGSFLTTGSSSALYSLSSDELTITKRALQYKFPLPSLIALGYATYYAQWVERFTPAGGGSPVDTPKDYSWDGSATETPVYTINPPSTPGTITVVGFSYGC